MESTQTLRVTITHIDRRSDEGFVAVSAIGDEMPGLYWVSRDQLTEFLKPIDLERALALNPATEPPEWFALAVPVDIFITGKVGYSGGSAWFTTESVRLIETTDAEPDEVSAESDAEGESAWDTSLFPICIEFEPVIRQIREAVGVLGKRPGLEASSIGALARLKHSLRRLPACTPGMESKVSFSWQTDENGSSSGLFLYLSEESFLVEYGGYVIGPCGGDGESQNVLSCETSGYRSDEFDHGEFVFNALEAWASAFENCCRDPEVKVDVSDCGESYPLEDLATEALWNRMPSHYQE